MKYYFGKLKVLLLAVAIIGIGFIFVWAKLLGNLSPSNISETDPDATGSASLQEQKVDLYVDYGNGKTTSYEGIIIDTKSTVLSILKKKLEQTGSTVTTKSYNFGAMVESINGITNNSEYFWAFSVNGQAGSISADKYILKNGDVVEWKYTKIQ